MDAGTDNRQDPNSRRRQRPLDLELEPETTEPTSTPLAPEDLPNRWRVELSMTINGQRVPLQWAAEQFGWDLMGPLTWNHESVVQEATKIANECQGRVRNMVLQAVEYARKELEEGQPGEQVTAEAKVIPTQTTKLVAPSPIPQKVLPTASPPGDRADMGRMPQADVSSMATRLQNAGSGEEKKKEKK